MKTSRFIYVCLFFAAAVFAAAETDADSIDTNNLFGDSSGPLVEEPSGGTSSKKDFTKDLLTSKTGVTIGGTYTSEITAGLVQTDLTNPSKDTLDDTYSVDLGSTVFFDARPDDTIRVLGKVDITYPFTYKADDPSTPFVDESRTFSDVFHVTELFSDFNIDNKIFFRAGKSTINWGVGYYFSPADLLNLSKIDPENPDDELEGPVSVKMNVPVGLDNYYIYIVSPDGITSASELAVAPKAEFVIGDSEIGIGGYYQKDQAPAVMSTLTSSIGDISLLGEAVVTYGSNKTFVNRDFSTVTYDDTFFFKGTAGIIYSWSDDLSNFSFSFSGQYLYNGEGYSKDDQDFISANRTTVLLPMVMAGTLSLSDIQDTGRHYGAATLSWNELLQSDFTLSVFWLGNLSDGSGIMKPSLTYTRFDNIKVSLSFPYNYGESGDEYTPSGDSLGVSLTFYLGETSF